MQRALIRPALLHRNRMDSRRIFISCLIGLVAGWLSAVIQSQSERGAGDLTWAIRLLPDLFAGIDPYSYPISLTPMAYPLTAGVVTYPLVIFPPAVAAGVFISISSALMAYSLLRSGEPWRLLAFASYPYWLALITVQWAPLLLAVALLPSLLPFALAKPHIGLPILLTRLTWKRAVACTLLGVGTLLLMPDWPLRWLGHQAAPIRYMLPLLTLPVGPLLLFALRHWRDKDVQLFLLLAAVPQHRWGYDTLLLWLLPRTPRQALALTCMSWVGAGVMLLATAEFGVTFGSAAAVAFWYGSALLVVLTAGSDR